jgi:hypothetical protein
LGLRGSIGRDAASPRAWIARRLEVVGRSARTLLGIAVSAAAVGAVPAGAVPLTLGSTSDASGLSPFVVCGLAYFAVTMLPAVDPRWRELDQRAAPSRSAGRAAGVPLGHSAKQ